MESKKSLFSFAKAKGNLVAVALAAVLMAANTTVALAQNKVTENNGTEKRLLEGLTTFMALILRKLIVQLSTQMKPTEIRLCVCITSVPKSF